MSQNTIDLLTHQLQSMWSGDARAYRWVTDQAIESLSSFKNPMPFILVEPLVTQTTCLAFIEFDDAKRFTSELSKRSLPLSHEDIGNAATNLALDLLWERSKQHQLAEHALGACLANFCLFETGRRIFVETPPTGHQPFCGLLIYAKKKFSGDGEIVCRPFAGHTIDLLSEEDILSTAAQFVEIDSRNHPEMRKRFPLNKFLKAYL